MHDSRGQTTRHVKLAPAAFALSAAGVIAITALLAGCGASPLPRAVPSAVHVWTLGDSGRAAGRLRLSLARTDRDSLVVVIAASDSARDTLPRLLADVQRLARQARTQPNVSAVAMAIPASDTAGFPAAAFLPSVDYIVLELNREHSASTGPGPIASPSWVRRALGARAAEIGAARLVAALPLYGYQWQVNGAARRVSVAEARRVAAEANVEFARDPASGALHATRAGRWDLWVADADQMRLLRDEATALGITTFLVLSNDR
jgi:hypothetical protein